MHKKQIQEVLNKISKFSRSEQNNIKKFIKIILDSILYKKDDSNNYYEKIVLLKTEKEMGKGAIKEFENSFSIPLSFFKERSISRKNIENYSRIIGVRFNNILNTDYIDSNVLDYFKMNELLGKYFIIFSKILDERYPKDSEFKKKKDNYDDVLNGVILYNFSKKENSELKYINQKITDNNFVIGKMEKIERIHIEMTIRDSETGIEYFMRINKGKWFSLSNSLSWEYFYDILENKGIYKSGIKKNLVSDINLKNNTLKTRLHGLKLKYNQILKQKDNKFMLNNDEFTGKIVLSKDAVIN